MSYRYDIEGLRATAVLLVVIFHINEALIPGGFIGVDLFFVISGYVITQRIYKDGLDKPGAFLEFYRRRIRRITPVMLFVTAATLIAGVFILLPEDLLDLAWSAVFAAFSAANIYFTFFLDTSYFANDSRYVPLLHLWSLGVEEQFYLVWPLLLFVLMRFPRVILSTLILVMVGSMAWGEYWLRAGDYSAAYYMLPSRAFQLCAGGFCLFLAQTSFIKRTSPSALLTIGAIGAALIAGSAYGLTGQDKFPGLNAVPVTVGASLVLLAGTKTTILSRILSISPARFIGGISYSMYLWHWPILAYLRYVYVDIDLPTGLVVLAAIIGVSYLSTRFIEDPFRHSKRSFKEIFLSMFAAPTAALTLACSVFLATSGYVPLFSPENYENKLAELRDGTKPAYDYPYVCQETRVTVEDTTGKHCIINGTEEPKTLLWGDSNAAHYIGILREIAKSAGASFRNIEHSACPPVLADGYRFAKPRFRNACKRSLPLVKAILSNYDHIIIAASYSAYTSNVDFFPALKATIEKLTKSGKTVTLIGQTVQFINYDRFCQQKALKFGIECQRKFSANIKGAQSLNRKLSRMVAQIDGARYIDFNDLICPKESCSPYREGKAIYFDGGHISMDGSQELGKQAVADGSYKDLFLH